MRCLGARGATATIARCCWPDGRCRRPDFDNKITDHLDTSNGSDPCPLMPQHLRAIATLSGPIWDRANRVAQACHLERIVANTRPPNWPYRRFYRSPLSVPLDTAGGAPYGREGLIAKGGRTDRWPQITAIPSRTILLLLNMLLYNNQMTPYIEPRTAPTILPWVRLLARSPGPGAQLQGNSSAPSWTQATRP